MWSENFHKYISNINNFHRCLVWCWLNIYIDDRISHISGDIRRSNATFHQADSSEATKSPSLPGMMINLIIILIFFYVNSSFTYLMLMVWVILCHWLWCELILAKMLNILKLYTYFPTIFPSLSISLGYSITALFELDFARIRRKVINNNMMKILYKPLGCIIASKVVEFVTTRFSLIFCIWNIRRFSHYFAVFPSLWYCTIYMLNCE